MRKFFFFKSSSNPNEEINRTSPLPSGRKKVLEGDTVYNGSKTPDESASKLRKRYNSEQEISSPHLRRSLSFSSPASYYDMNPQDSLVHNSNHFISDCPIHHHLLTEEREESEKGNDIDISSSNESHISPVEPNCGPSCIKNRSNKNKYLDVYIEGEEQQQQTTTTQEENQSSSSETNKEVNSLNRKTLHLGLGKPPRTRSTEPFGELRDFESETATSVEDIYEDNSGSRPFWSNPMLDSDEMLMMKAREAEERLLILSEENFDPDLLRTKGVTSESLFKLIQGLNEERKFLARELCVQIKSRIAEGLKSKEKYRVSRLELETRTRRLEMEKTALQLNIEKEWSTKVNKFQSEEKRLRERVRELAEQNVSLQRDLCVLKSREENSINKITDYEAELDHLRRENSEISNSLMDVTENYNEAEGQLGHFRRCYKEKEDENKGLQKAVVRLQRICSEQGKSVNTLRNDKNPRDFDSEILRLIGVEYKLRREIECYRQEIESLRRENISFLERLKKGNDLRLEEEINARVEILQTKCFCLVKESSELNNELLGFVKSVNNSNNIDEFNLLDYSLKYESVRKGVEGLKRSLICVESVLAEKSSSDTPLDNNNNSTEGDVELRLKSEVLINKVLREKIFSKDEEVEQLEEEIANLVRGNDLLQSEIQRLQDELSCLTYKSKDLDIQVVKKDERINQLREELQEAVKELGATRSMLKTVLEERDLASQEVSNLKKINKNLIDNNNFLSKRVESLDEDLLFKEGQISILKDGTKPLKDFLL